MPLGRLLGGASGPGPRHRARDRPGRFPGVRGRRPGPFGLLTNGLPVLIITSESQDSDVPSSPVDREIKLRVRDTCHGDATPLRRPSLPARV